MATDDERDERQTLPPDVEDGERLRQALAAAASLNFKIDLSSGRAVAFGTLPRWLPADDDVSALTQLLRSVHPDDAASYSLDALVTLPAGTVREGTFRVVLGNGTTRRLRCRIRVLRDDEGTAQTLFGVLTESPEPNGHAPPPQSGTEVPLRRRGEPQFDVRRTMLEEAMREGLRHDQFHLEYQPVVDIWTGEATAVEALARWHHPELGDVRPAEFIPVAETSGLIVPLGEWVLGQACRDLARFDDLPKLTMCVNVSGRQLTKPGIDEAISAGLGETGLDAERLCLEITESVLMEDPEASVATLERLKALGTRIVLDDFGTGYSSLAYVRRFPIDILKIDREFVADLIGEHADATIVEAVLSMARGLRVDVIAEGVETAQHDAALRGLGCRLAQGYHYARPTPPDELPPLLDRLSLPTAIA
jgi:EAL domain-containing protein (putative c-di-GMP-specific phosphodiesterase class I)